MTDSIIFTVVIPYKTYSIRFIMSDISAFAFLQKQVYMVSHQAPAQHLKCLLGFIPIQGLKVTDTVTVFVEYLLPVST